MLKLPLAATAVFLTAAMPLIAQSQMTGAGNPQLTCTQFLDLDETAQMDAVATLMLVGSDTMPETDATTDSGAAGDTSGSDAAQAAEAQTEATDLAPETGVMDESLDVSPDMVRAIANICANSVEPS